MTRRVILLVTTNQRGEPEGRLHFDTLPRSLKKGEEPAIVYRQDLTEILGACSLDAAMLWYHRNKAAGTLPADNLTKPPTKKEAQSGKAVITGFRKLRGPPDRRGEAGEIGSSTAPTPVSVIEARERSKRLITESSS